MSLPAPELDDRRFQDIVDEAKRRITRLCPEWTDHNVSDPGVALIELFAWMTEMTLYRLNQVPDRLYVKFLELVGVELFSAVPARVDLLFTLTAAREETVRVPAGTQVPSCPSQTVPGAPTKPLSSTVQAVSSTANRQMPRPLEQQTGGGGSTISSTAGTASSTTSAACSSSSGFGQSPFRSAFSKPFWSFAWAFATQSGSTSSPLAKLLLMQPALAPK